MRNRIGITLTGDERDAARAFDRVGDGARDMSARIDRESRDAGRSFDRVGEHADNTATRTSTLAGAFGDLAGGLDLIGLGGFGDKLEALAPAIMGVAGAADILTIATESLNLTFLASPITWIVLGVAALVAGIVIAYKKSETFRRIVHAAFDKVKKAAKAVVDFFRHDIPKAFDKVKDAATAVKSWVTRRFDDLVGFVRGLPRRVTGAVSGIFDRVRDAATNARDWVTGRFDALVNWVGRLPGRIGRAARGLWDGITDGVRSAINFLIDAWNSLDFGIHVHLPGWLGGYGFDIDDVIPDLPRLAAGGITTGPTLALVGDNPGGREAIIPLDRYPLGGGPNINLNGTFIGASRVEVGRWVQSALDAYYQAGGRRAS